MVEIADDKVKFIAYKGVKSSVGMEPTKVLRKLVTHADLTAEDTSDTVDFDDTIPDGAILMGFGHKLLEDFADATETISAVTLDLGDGSNVDRFIDAADIFTGASNTFVAQTADAVGDGADTGGLPLAISAELTLTATITATGGNVDTLTAGRVMIYAYYFFPEDPDA